MTDPIGPMPSRPAANAPAQQSWAETARELAAANEDWSATATAPEHERTQDDGRLRRWRRIPKAGDRWLRVVLLGDARTIHNAFFDRGFDP